MTVRLRFSILLSLAIAVLTLSAFGQTATGTVSGIVADSNGAVILGTKVVLENRETRLRRQAMSKEISCLRLFPGTGSTAPTDPRWGRCTLSWTLRASGS